MWARELGAIYGKPAALLLLIWMLPFPFPVSPGIETDDLMSSALYYRIEGPMRRRQTGVVIWENQLCHLGPTMAFQPMSVLSRCGHNTSYGILIPVFRAGTPAPKISTSVP